VSGRPSPEQVDAGRGGMIADFGAILPTDHPPHQFVGRADRWCEVCDLPDRHPVHKTAAVRPTPEQVDAALAWEQSNPRFENQWPQAVAVLAAEVVALRAERDEALETDVDALAQGIAAGLIDRERTRADELERRLAEYEK
jgi:hypothetical protein